MFFPYFDQISIASLLPFSADSNKSLGVFFILKYLIVCYSKNLYPSKFDHVKLLFKGDVSYSPAIP